ncbi:MAG: heat shock protein [Cyanobacteriota bacterium]|jgi:rhodanese-related sulfurtransferase
MGQRFNTVSTEVIHWRSFTIEDDVYDLAHLHAHHAEYLDDRNANNPITYKFIVTYGLHCLTKELDGLSEEESQSLLYYSPRESRHFNTERYYLSKELPNIVLSLSQKTTLVCHAGYRKFASVKVLDSNGIEVEYFVVFTVFKESKKLRLHVQSAYLVYEGIGKIKKVSFLVIAHNLLTNKNLPKP